MMACGLMSYTAADHVRAPEDIEARVCEVTEEILE